MPADCWEWVRVNSVWEQHALRSYCADLWAGLSPTLFKYMHVPVHILFIRSIPTIQTLLTTDPKEPMKILIKLGAYYYKCSYSTTTCVAWGFWRVFNKFVNKRGYVFSCMTKQNLGNRKLSTNLPYFYKILGPLLVTNYCNYSTIWTCWFFYLSMCLKMVGRLKNSADVDQTAPIGAVWSGSTLFARNLCPYVRQIYGNKLEKHQKTHVIFPLS